MTASSSPESIRVHLSIRHGTAAYVVLAGCETPSARRAAAQNLMQAAATVLLTGRTDTPIATALAMPSASRPGLPHGRRITQGVLCGRDAIRGGCHLRHRLRRPLTARRGGANTHMKRVARASVRVPLCRLDTSLHADRMEGSPAFTDSDICEPPDALHSASAACARPSALKFAAIRRISGNDMDFW